nr:hypothetical protein [uncultured Methanoregula sp.]
MTNLNPVTKEQQYLQAILDQQEETNRLLRELQQAAPASEILEEPARSQQQKGGKRH